MQANTVFVSLRFNSSIMQNMLSAYANFMVVLTKYTQT